MRAFAVAALLPLAASPAEAAGATSAYTTIDLDRCAVLERDEEFGSMVWRCPGHAGIDVWVADDDARMLVSFGPDAERQPAAEQTLPPFNTIGNTLEWRIGPDGRPFATILRWHTSLDDGSSGQVLVVTRLATGGVCHVAYVDALANRDANVLARQAADTMAPGYDCAREPQIVGKRGRGLGF